MSIAPTIRCACDGRHRQQAVEYQAPPLGETRFDLRGREYRRAYDRCGLCEHWFGRHDLALNALYDRDYVDSTYGGADGMQRRFAKIMALPAAQSDNRQRVARIRTFVEMHGFENHRPRLLDVGAGLGVFPAAVAEGGWDVVALEPDARTVEHLRIVVGVQARTTALQTLTPNVDGRFDVITFNKVLEHVEDPVDLLRASVPLLTTNGVVYVEAPDVAAWSDGPGREEFFIEHHHVFSPASLSLTATRSGLSPLNIERVREPSGKFTLRMFATAAA